MQYPIYLDYNATTPCDTRVMEEMLPYFTSRFGNAASRTHAYGWVAEEAVTIGRERVAKLIGSDPSELIFTSGATEAVNLALRGVYETYQSKGKHIITYQTEHKAVLDTCAYLEKQGATVTYLPVDANGLPDLPLLEKNIQADTILIAAMYANNETGVLFPIKEMTAIAKKTGVLFFSDATQAVGKIPVDVLKDDIDLLALSAHKFYGPKGVGALYVRRKNPRVKLSPLQYGGGHEKGLRSGTLNVPGIVGLGKACDICLLDMQTDRLRIEQLRDQLLNGLLELGCTRLNGDKNFLLPHVANVSFDFNGAAQLIGQLSKHVAVSSGSACTSASAEPSHVLKAMGLKDEVAIGSIRFSLGRFTTEEEIIEVLKKIRQVVEGLQTI
ncbi:cysteine desulfurase family protein [Lacibacter sediminis]|uniref:cysteine desulfurase n=1 Tax=Lacibacter sediminis TaxID=2760713 RepID=A0A7G5XFI6_9BACT|nr:aminotransferase class V-fold PLP-dependent enzyme [Lacibacter sediminis]QNA44239.1 aminotransferase class V-fold PLP-dependent enzyme [Lacibacter sediminis]